MTLLNTWATKGIQGVSDLVGKGLLPAFVLGLLGETASDLEV